MTPATPASPAPTERASALGLPFVALVGLAALAVPRVVLHDLHVIEEGSPVTWLLALGPVAIWIAVAVARRVPRPFVTVLVVGVIFGVMLAITHQALWEIAFRGAPPVVGEGAGAGVVPRLVAVPSSLVTGAMIGAVGGLIAWGIRTVLDRTRR